MMKKNVVIALAGIAALCTVLPAVAQFQKPEDAVKYRKAAFTVMATHFGRIGAMVQGKVPFDAAAASANADIVATLSHLPFGGFADGTAGTEKGMAKASIWTERAKFDEAAKKMQDEAAKLATVARGGNLDQIKVAFGAVGQTCKACHDNYRNP